KTGLGIRTAGKQFDARVQGRRGGGFLRWSWNRSRLGRWSLRWGLIRSWSLSWNLRPRHHTQRSHASHNSQVFPHDSSSKCSRKCQHPVARENGSNVAFRLDTGNWQLAAGNWFYWMRPANYRVYRAASVVDCVARTLLSAAFDFSRFYTIEADKELMEFSLTETEVRVLGSLIEKDITTPEYYPLSLNA